MDFHNEFVETISLLSDNGVLEHVVLIGSWAEYLFEKCNVIDGFVSTTKTTDIDLLVKNIRKPKDWVDIIKMFEEADFIPDRSRTGIIVFRKNGFEVEFLARQIGRPSNNIVSPSFGMTLETLPHMAIICNNLIVVEYYDLHAFAVCFCHT